MRLRASCPYPTTSTTEPPPRRTLLTALAMRAERREGFVPPGWPRSRATRRLASCPSAQEDSTHQRKGADGQHGRAKSVRVKAHLSPYGFPVFDMPEGIEYWPLTTWLDMIGAIPPRYFVATSRMPADREPVRVRAVDCATFHEEGDELVLSVVELEMSGGSPVLLLLPLMRTVLADVPELRYSQLHRKLAADGSLVAFGIETLSDSHGARSWLVYDAFLGDEVLSLLKALFWPEHFFYALNVRGGEHGSFRFVTDEPVPRPRRSAALLERDREGNLEVSYRTHRLSIPADITASSLDPKAADPAGVIRYEGRDGSSLVVGILEARDRP